MTATALKKELSTYLPLLSARQQELVLNMVKNILHVDDREKRVSIEQYNTEIEAALKDAKQRHGVSHDDVIKQSRKWLKRK
jgi:DNA-directed RNA polymerase specialized sigma subunit